VQKVNVSGNLGYIGISLIGHRIKYLVFMDLKGDKAGCFK